MVDSVYFTTVLICMLVLIICTSNSRALKTGDKKIDVNYNNLKNWVIFFCLQDAVWGLADSTFVGNAKALYISSMIFHISTAVTTFFWVSFVCAFSGIKSEKVKIFKGLSRAIIVFQAAVLICGIWYPTIFYVDSQGMYQTAFLRPFCFALQYGVYILIGLVSSITAIHNHGEKRKKYFAVFMFVLSPILCGVFQLLFPYYPGYSIGYMLGCCIIHRFVVMTSYMEKTKSDNIIQRRYSDIITNDYPDVMWANLDEKTCRIIKRNGRMLARERYSEKKDYDETWSSYIIENVVEKDKNKVIKFVDIKNVKEGFKTEDTISCIYYSKGIIRDYANQITFYRVGDSEEALIAFRNVDNIVSDQLSQKKALSDALALANEASKAKTTFLFNMSHDIRTPMNAIIGFANLLEKDNSSPEKQLEYVKKIQSSGEYLLGLINNVLEMARIESGECCLDEAPLDLVAVGKDMQMIMEARAKQKNIKLVTDFQIDTPYVFCDGIKYREICMNLISNAIKYTPEGGTVTMRGRCVPMEGRDDYVIANAIIEDTGIGMSKEFLPHLFDAFARERNTTESQIQGSGLGMGIVKRYVDAMGGTIEVESELGKGTKASVKLPLKLSSQAPKEEIPKTLSIDFSGLRILMAEDNELNAEIAMTILTEYGADVEHAADGVECIDMLTKHDPEYFHVILMDVQMPNMDGLKATREIRRMPDKRLSSIPIIALTANAFDEDKQKAIESGMNDFVAKPIDIPKLIDTLSKVLN